MNSKLRDCMMAGASVLLLTSGAQLWAQDTPGPSDRKVTYSPYPTQTYPNRVYFGDTHLHTSYSTDAGMVGATVGPEEAYRFARGEEVNSNNGAPVRLQRPLDFLVIADHAENLGLAPMIAESSPALLTNEWGKQVHDLVKAGKGPEAFNLWAGAMQALKDPFKGQEEPLARPIVAAPDGRRREVQRARPLHGHHRLRVDVGAERQQPAPQRHVPRRQGEGRPDHPACPTTTRGDPEDLWTWMETYEKKTGGKLLAIAHNGNLSNGLMFDDVTLTTKKPLDRDYAERRMRWEPVYETTQPKGDGETHPFLSPNDEFANFERWDKGSFGPQFKTPDMLPREYTREALKRGLAYEASSGSIPSSSA